MRFRARIGHGIDGKRDVESRFVRLSSRCFDTGSRRHARDDDLRNAACLELRFKVSARKRTPCSLRHDDIVGLAIQLRNQIAESLRERRKTAWLLSSSWRASGYIDQNDRQIVLSKVSQQGAGSLNDFSDWVDKG